MREEEKQSKPQWEWIHQTLTDHGTQSLLIVNPRDQVLSDFLSPPAHQDSFPFSRFPRLGLSIKDEADPFSNFIIRKRSHTNPTFSSPLSKSVSSVSNLDLDADDQIETGRDLSQSLSSLPTESDYGITSIPTSTASERGFERDSIFSKQLHLSKLGVLSKDGQVLNDSKELILKEEDRKSEKTRWKDLEVNVFAAQRLDLEDERLKGYDGIILDFSFERVEALSPSDCMPLIKLFLTKYKPSTLILLVPFQSEDPSRSSESRRNSSSSGWSSSETLENFCTSISVASSGSSSTYVFKTPAVFVNEDQTSAAACCFHRDPALGKRISDASTSRGRSRRGERRWTSAALSKNRSVGKTHQGKTSAHDATNTSLSGISVSSPPLARNTLSGVPAVASRTSRPSLSTSRSVSTSQVPVSTSPDLCSTNGGSIESRLGCGNVAEKEKERERILSPCSDLLRGRSVSIERSHHSGQDSTTRGQHSPGLITSSPLMENHEGSLNDPDVRDIDEESDDEEDDADVGASSSSASSVSSLRGRGRETAEKEEIIRSPRSRRQEVLPWLSGNSPISSPELGDGCSPQNKSTGKLGSTDETFGRGRDPIVRPPVRMDELGSNGPELKFPHTLVLSRILRAFDEKNQANHPTAQHQVLSTANPFENDPIFDEIIFKLKSNIKTDSLVNTKSGSSTALGGKDDQTHAKLLSEVWKDLSLRKACQGKIVSLLDAIRLVHASEEEISLEVDSSRAEMGDLIGSDGKTWSLRLIRRNGLEDDGDGEGSKDLDKELFLVYDSGRA